MKKLTKALLILISIIGPSPIFAQDNTTIFANCLVDALNGKERKEMAKWIFMSMAVHPSIELYASISDDGRLKSDKYVGALVTRLLAEECPNEMAAAHKDNPLAIKKGFELVGQVAMQEIMTNEATMVALTEYAKYVDMEKIKGVLAK